MDKTTLIIAVLRSLLDLLTRDEDKDGIPDVFEPFIPNESPLRGKLKPL